MLNDTIDEYDKLTAASGTAGNLEDDSNVIKKKSKTGANEVNLAS